MANTVQSGQSCLDADICLSVGYHAAGDLMVAANKGAQSGWLVPLSAGLCYLGKQGSFMPLRSISRVQFHRTGAGSATFDITIKLAAAAGASKSLELGQIDASELPKLQAYCMNQRIKVRRAGNWCAHMSTSAAHICRGAHDVNYKNKAQ